MTFLGTCCRDQQVKQYNNLSRYKKLKQVVRCLGFALVILLLSVVSSANAQMGSAQAGIVQAKVQLELLTNSNRILSGNGNGASSVAIGSEVGLRVSSDRDTYIYIFNYDAVGTLSPLTDSSNNFLRVGTVHNYPSVNSRYKVLGPAGRESIFAIASLRPLSENRLQQLVIQQIQGINSGVNNSRALINGGSSPVQASQDGWLADSIIFDVFGSNTVNTAQAPVTQAPTTQIPAAPIHAPIHTAPQQPSNTSQRPNGFKACSLANLNLSAPSNSLGFSQRCINRSFDSSFENPAGMKDIVVHFGTELVNQGFSYQATTKGEEHDFRATFSYQGKTYQMQVEKSGKYYRFELLEFSQQAMN